MPVILATWEAEIRRTEVQGQPRQIVCETPISKITRAKWTGGSSPEFKPQPHQKKKKSDFSDDQ
jgi:hypothetical protein